MKYFYTSFTKIAQWISLVQSHITRYVTHYNFFFSAHKNDKHKRYRKPKRTRKTINRAEKTVNKKNRKRKIWKNSKSKNKKSKRIKNTRNTKIRIRETITQWKRTNRYSNRNR